MKVKKFFSEKWLIIYILIAAAILYFIYSLGFMTSFYRLFFDGDSNTLKVYNELQLLNSFIFESSLITLILSVLALVLGLHAKKTGIINSLFLIGFTAYEINSLATFSSAIPYYINNYLKLDVSFIEGYVKSPFIFTLSYFFCIGIIVILLITGIFYVIHMIRQKIKNKGVKPHE